MCRQALAPLRKGGMRPWRPITQQHYQKRLEMFLGWFQREHASSELGAEHWATLLWIDHCRDYLNWLIARSGKAYVNPGHTSFLRMVRGFHRFLLNSPHGVIQGFTDLARRCEVEERDKAVRMVPYPKVADGFRQMLAMVTETMRSSSRSQADQPSLAILQVDAIVLGLLATRALRRSNIIGIQVDKNLVRTSDGFELRYAAKEMKGHRKFETRLPAELVPVVNDYLARGYRALTGRMPTDGDLLLLDRKGNPLSAATFTHRVRRLTRKHVGKELHPHLFRHIIATHAAQEWKMSVTELAAFLAHKSVLTITKYYEVTNPARAAERFDTLRQINVA